MNIIERVKNMLVSPKTEWGVVAGEEQSLSTVLTTYVLPLSLIGAGATLIGWGLIGKSYSWGFGSFTVKGWDIGIKYAIISLVSTIVGFLITTFVVDALAPSFGSEKNLNKSAQYVGYSYTPALVAAVLTIFPTIAWLGSLLGGLYTLYLMWLGIGPMKKTPEDKKVVYLIVCIVVLIVAWIILGLILVSILGLGTIGTGNVNIG
jgi:hypothetical protein